MVHLDSKSGTNVAGNRFDEYILRGDDFLKIELLRQAKNWYLKALAIDSENDYVKSRISECEKKLAFENRVTLILVVTATAILIAYFLF